MYLSLDTQHKHTFTIKDRRQKIVMAQTIVVALCIIAAAVAAAASVPSASASDQTTAMHLLPVEAAEVLTKGRAGGVQRELLDESWVRDADEARSGVAGIQSQRELLGESWVGGADEARSGIAGIQAERQLTATDAIPATTEKLLPVGAAEILTKGRAGGVAIQKELTGVNVPAAFSMQQ